MNPLPLDRLAQVLCALAPPREPPPLCTSVSIDTRSLQAGELYVAIRGENHDGHDFVPQALAQGAIACLVDHNLPAPGPLLVVDDTVTALGRWAQWYRTQSSARVIGITGSVGKTTTRRMIGHVLAQAFRCWQSPKNFNNQIGLPLTLLGAPPDTEIVVTELGSNSPGEIATLAQIAQPDIALVTYAAVAHLQGFGSLAGVVEEKLSICTGLRQGGTLILNADCSALMQGARAAQVQALTYGLHDRANVRGTDVTLGPQGSTFTVDGHPVTLPVPGPGNVQNALACWTVCRQLGLAPETIVTALATLPPLSLRGECVTVGGLTVLNDCYNANPASMVNALQTLALLDPEGRRRRVFVCGHMAELGPEAERLHEELGPAIAAARVDHIVAIGPLAQRAAQAAQTLRPETQFSRYEDVDAVCPSLGNEIREQDVILVKGSRSAGLEKILHTLQEQHTGQRIPITNNH